MNTSVLHRRRIERYAQLLDEASGARRRHARSPIDDELANMLTIGGSLSAAAPDLAPTDTFRMEARARIMATAERKGVGRTYREDTDELVVARPAVGRASVGTVHESAARRLLPGRRVRSTGLASPNRSRARVAILAGLAVGTLALSGISAASGSALPGSALYGMKRSAENAQITLAGSDESRGKLYLDFAQTRVTEAQRVTADPAMLSNVLDTMDSQTITGVRLLLGDAIKHRSPGDLDTIDAFVTYQDRQMASLLSMVASSPAEHARVVRSQGDLDFAHVRSTEIRPMLKCATALKVTGSDPFGPEVTCTVGASTDPGTTPVRDDGLSARSVASKTYDGRLSGSVERIPGGP